YLTYNKLTGSIPNGMSSLTALDALRMTGNHLDGTIPSFLNLNVIELSNNALTGSIPSSIFSPDLVSLYEAPSRSFMLQYKPTCFGLKCLDRNYLNGTIPSSLGNVYGLMD
ncbi:unnamed protein product, partial [Closterium sp. NIES-64]